VSIVVLVLVENPPWYARPTTLVWKDMWRHSGVCLTPHSHSHVMIAALGLKERFISEKARFQRGEQDGRNAKTAQLLTHAGLISFKEKGRQGNPEARNQDKLSALGVA
jgi:hypothetical protein